MYTGARDEHFLKLRSANDVEEEEEEEGRSGGCIVNRSRVVIRDRISRNDTSVRDFIRVSPRELFARVADNKPLYAIVYHRYYLHRDVTSERVRDRNLFISSVGPFPENESENFSYCQFQFLSSFLSLFD